MGKEGVKIIHEIEVKKVIEMLNSALSEEWLVFYQYWLGAQLMEGPMRTAIEAELMKHAQEEFGHAALVATRIIQLDGIPVTSPQDWFKLSKCKYFPPTDLYIETILKENLSGERCAIETYQTIANYTDGLDYATYRMATQILSDELEHEQDIEDWLQDIKQMKEHIAKK